MKKPKIEGQLLMQKQKKAILLGVAVGDALGVPVEFEDREDIQANPVTAMRGFGTHAVPAGTWSDDTSLTLCLVEALLEDRLNLSTLAQNFVQWAHHNWWTPRGEVFDIGISTEDAIQKLVDGVHPEQSGGTDELDNGNGSLMRILPLVMYIRNMEINERFRQVKSVSSVTHGHIRAVMACFYYLEFARLLLLEMHPVDIFKQLQHELPDFFQNQGISPSEIDHFHRLLGMDLASLDEADIQSTGYVVHTLEASIWCLLTTQSYQEAVLKAVNLGDDTDTTAAVTGGLAGLGYGVEQIPTEWINTLARKEDILALADRWGNVD